MDTRVGYYIQGSTTGVYFTSEGVTFALSGATESEKGTVRQRWTVKLDFIGAKTGAGPVGRDRTAAVVSYFKGDETEWKTGLPTYSNVVYRDLWPGIDLVYTGTSGRLKYTFVLQPEADPNQIQLGYRGATDVRLTEEGRLAVSTPVGGFEDEAPYAYQELDGGRTQVEVAYALDGNGDSNSYRYRFRLGVYDRSEPLILDPAILAYCGYIGGSANDSGESIAVDSFGNAYISGSTVSSEATFPVTVGPDLTYSAGTDVYVAKLNPSGTALIYCGYIGGSGNEVGTAIAIDGAGSAYVTGYSSSDQATFPVTVGPDLTYNGGLYDAYVAKVNASGTALTYCGYIGGFAEDLANGVAVDNTGNAYVTGNTGSDQVTFPVTVGPDLTYNGGLYDAYVAKVNAGGTALTYCGYIGGSAGEIGSAIAVDSAGGAYVTGYTESDEATFPVAVGPDTTYNSGTRDAFVAKLDAGGAALSYCGYIGGSGSEWGRAIAVDSAGNAYVNGRTDSTELSAIPFPVTVGPDLTYNGGLGDAYVTKVDAGGAAFIYCGYIGGSGDDYANGIAVDSSGNAHIAGDTSSDEASFPVRVGPDLTHNGLNDAYVAKVRSTGTALEYCGYVGGANSDYGHDIALDSSGNVYVVGNTQSDEASFPVTVGPDLAFNGGVDAFVAKLSEGALKLVGFETGEPIPSEITSLGAGASIDSTTVRPGSGGYSLKQATDPSVLTSGLSPALDNLALRFSFLKPANPALDQPLVHFNNGAANRWSLQLKTTGTLDIQHNESSLSGTWNNTTLSDNTWYTIRLIYDRQADGVLRVWLDSALEIDVSHATGGTAIDNVEFAGDANPNEYFYDDIYLMDTAYQPPLGQIVRLSPNGPGNLTEFDSEEPVSSVHWRTVDEVPPSSSDYSSHVALSVATDLYALVDSPSATVNAVKGMWQMMRGNGMGGGTHDYAWSIDGINRSAEFVGLGASWQLKEVVWTTPPEIGGTWTEARVNSLELGAKHNGTHNQNTYISWTAAMVDYYAGAAALYRSVGITVTDLNTSSRTVEIAGDTATFSGPVPDNVGVGDVLQYQVAATDYLAFIHGRTSDTVYTVKSSTGGNPQAAAVGTAVGVYRAYTSLFNWEAQDENDFLNDTVEDFDTSTDLVTNNTVMNVACYGDGVDTTMVIVDGWTTGADNYIKIYTPVFTREVGTSQRHDGKWNTSAYRLEFAGEVLIVSDNYVRIDGLQVRLTADVVGVAGITFNGASGTSYYEVCNSIIRGNGNGIQDIRMGVSLFNAGSGELKIWNNIIYDWAGGSGLVAGIAPDDPDFIDYIYNNTIVDCEEGIAVYQGTVVAKNNLVYNSADNYVGSFDASSTNNLSGPAQSDAPGLNPRNAATVAFVDEPGDDFHLDPSDTGAQDYGANLSTDSNLTVYWDIDLKLRQDPWDIGADDVVATTAVELVYFSARGLDGEVLLEWETASEVDNLGSYIYRAVSKEGPYERVNGVAIPGLGSSPVGARYRYIDPGLVNGITYYYELEDFEASGKRKRHGPVAATPKAGVTWDPTEDDPSEEATPPRSRITFGDPESVSFRVIKEEGQQVVLKLDTGGFYAEPQDDGTVRVFVPGFSEEFETGRPEIPVKRAWVEALAGRNVRIVFVRAEDVQTFSLRPAVAGKPVVEVSGRGAIRAARRPRRGKEAHQGAGLYPDESARVVSVGFQEDVKKALLELAPLRWDERAGRLLLARHIEVHVVFDGRVAEERSLGGSRGRRYRRRNLPIVSHVAARFATRRRGLYGVRFEDVFGTSRPTLGSSQLRVSRQGERVAYHTEPNPRHFGPGSVLYFVSEGADLNPYGQEAVYELEVGREGEVMEEVKATPQGASLEHYLHGEAFEENVYIAISLEAEPFWFWDMVMSGGSNSFGFTVSALSETAESGELELRVLGYSSEESAPEIHAEVWINEVLLSEPEWASDMFQILKAEIPPGVLREGENTLVLKNPSPSRYAVLALNRFQVVYPRKMTAEEGVLRGVFTHTGTAEVTEVEDATHVLDVTETPRWLTKTQIDPNGVQFYAEADHDYLVVADASVLTPDIRRASSSGLKSTRNRADYIVLGPKDMLAVAEPLLELRRSQGLAGKAVAIEDVFAEFGHGESRPDAVAEFLRYAYHEWRSPQPRYVALLGDGTYDFKNYLGAPETNQVPPRWEKTTWMWTASDPSYARVNGEDILPDLAIGRIPASTVDEARVMVEKIVAYERSDYKLFDSVVLVTDNPDKEGDYEEDAEELAGGILTGLTLKKVYLGQLGTGATRAEIRKAFDEGASLLSYMGHGAVHVWAHENIFNTGTIIDLLPQEQQPLILTINCLNGFFHYPYFDALAEELVKTEGKGAVAAISPSGLSLNTPAHRFHKSLLEELLSGKHAHLGDAILTAQASYAEAGSFLELLSIFHLFGDPAMRIQ